MNGTNVESMLIRAGVVAERAKRDGRSLSKDEQTILEAARKSAWYAGFSRQRQNALEMEGQTTFKEVMSKTKVVAKFAYYNPGFEEIKPYASFFIIESNHPSLPEKGNVGAEELKEVGIKVPKHPTYEEWIKNGSPIFRGGL
jgi:hypothetical protein